MSNCIYCENGIKLKNAMSLIMETQYSKIFLKTDQKHPGRCIVQFKEHKTELFQLTEDERKGFMDDVCVTAEAIAKVFKADKINYAIYGDLVSHLHFHIVPKTKDGLNWGVPFDDTLPIVKPSEDEKNEYISKLYDCIDELKNK